MSHYQPLGILTGGIKEVYKSTVWWKPNEKNFGFCLASTTCISKAYIYNA
ncbi:uncharacterized protein METZ01_LOCUS178571 [marine metagenome]|uniref:Uncharacterized protein n=1 Tax=marine metagenome TaxID=408172 RepID=A0A382CK65_9ZZZZ